MLAAQTKDADDPEVPAVNKSPDDVSNSPTSPQPPVTSTVAGSYDAMTLKGLRSAAVGMGLDDEAIEEARDADDPKAALIALLNAHDLPTQPAVDYSIMNSKDLRASAAHLGIEHEAIEEARDADDPKAALIALINTHTNSRQPTAADTDSLVANAPGYIAVASKSTTSSSAVQAP